MKADMADLRMALRGMYDSGTGEAAALLFAALDELANYRALDQRPVLRSDLERAELDALSEVKP